MAVKQGVSDKLCECGCGLPAPLAKQTDRRRGVVKGQPQHFVNHHHRRAQGQRYVVEDRGYLTPCWIWQGSLTPQGYGRTTHYGRQTTAHRAFYERANGPLPPGYEPDHLCRVRACVRPDHLEAVTRRENARRGLAGANVRKLTPEQSAAIRASARSGVALAAEYGVSPARISQIRRGA